MTDIFTYLFYLSLMSFVFFTSFYLRNKKIKYKQFEFDIFYILILLVLSFFIGFRFEVGVDWSGYVSIYHSISSNSKFNYSQQFYELGFYSLNWLMGVFDLGYQGVFFIMAFISWYFYFKSVPKYIIPFFVFFLFSEEYFFWGMNGVRQFAAMGLWVFSVKFIVDRNFKLFLLLVCAASLFHSTSLLLIPFYFLPYDKLYNQFFWILIYGCSLILFIFIDLSIIFQNFELLFLSLSKNIGVIDRYVGYVDRGQITSQDVSLGYGFVFKLVVNLFIIVFSKNLIKWQPSLRPYIVLFFIGAILFNVFYEVKLIGRLFSYFLIFRPLLLSYIVYYLYFIKRKRFISLLVMFLYIIVFLGSMYGNSNMCCPYQISF
ncbi:EpsG family protein [Mongoliibacter ruber]|uniref:EpsG-like putative glucosyltransferase n=1 Tax=Mongoliibacter ruber TaxID=1750599 RepID=A0A2T0WNV1_9BACT|nr:EpsG family protein [Mongoliibacter ruber]PRY88365.1 EpsG-like putative glucosyltransferase [Mongoliibacter ruber]